MFDGHFNDLDKIMAAVCVAISLQGITLVVLWSLWNHWKVRVVKEG